MLCSTPLNLFGNQLILFMPSFVSIMFYGFKFKMKF